MCSPTAASIISKLKTNPSTIYIKVRYGAGNEFNYKFNPVCYFDPSITRLPGAGSWRTRPPEIGLAHELIHALHYLEGIVNRTDEENWTVGVNPNQFIFSENQIRLECGLGRRPEY